MDKVQFLAIWTAIMISNTHILNNITIGLFVLSVLCTLYSVFKEDKKEVKL
jgi:hypothetical protein